MRKTAAAAAMAASLTLGGAAGVALFAPTLSGAQTDETTPADETTESLETLRAERTERIGEVLASLVEDGTITQAQSDAVAERLAEAMPLRQGRHHGIGVDIVAAAAEALGLEPDALRERLADGESLAEVAEAGGVELQAVTDALVAAHQVRLDEAVADGDLTQERADEMAARFAEHVDELVERGFEPGFRRGPGQHGGHGGGGDVAPADEPADDTTDS